MYEILYKTYPFPKFKNGVEQLKTIKKLTNPIFKIPEKLFNSNKISQELEKLF